MLSKKSMKILSIIVMVVMLLITLGNVAFASDITVPDPAKGANTDMTKVEGKVSNLLWIIQWGGIMVAVVIAMFVGIKYITAAPEGKAEIKKTIGFYVAGVVLLLSASAIVTAIQSALK